MLDKSSNFPLHPERDPASFLSPRPLSGHRKRESNVNLLPAGKNYFQSSLSHPRPGLADGRPREAEGEKQNRQNLSSIPSRIQENVLRPPFRRQAPPIPLRHLMQMCRHVLSPSKSPCTYLFSPLIPSHSFFGCIYLHRRQPGAQSERSILILTVHQS